ncbi:AAA-ATPase At1g43910-like [Rutidosis leptorrhynchoides]|uniref:AAA-ATPase At1g43910-like n=1 Tax=Rutidosis leptorrhynchoides TaxID=125765 RepID=UPI003A98F651
MFNGFPSISTVFSVYASISAVIMILSETIPEPVRNYLTTKFSKFFVLLSYYFTSFTFVVEERWQAVDNKMFIAVQAYLPTRIGPTTNSYSIGSNDFHDFKSQPKIAIPVDIEVKDQFEGIKVSWILRSKEVRREYGYSKRRSFELTCNKKSREILMEKYIPHILETAEKILNKREMLHILTYDKEENCWQPTMFKHPSTFETLAMEPDLKKSIMEDLDLFVKRKEFFESVGRAWKRGYLLYGPPGTGKSSLVAAIANYLRYDIYDLQMQSVKDDSDLRRLLTSTTNKSILLIEDIDCSTKISHDRSKSHRQQQQQDDYHSDIDNENEDDRNDHRKRRSSDPGATLSGLLNFIDGLWSSCGDERIIIFTTNHKEKLDPALLRPGRMDVHVYMGHSSPSVFRKLVTSYLGIKNHDLFSSIEDLIQRVKVTPAEVAQHLMKNDNPDVALQSLVEFINTKENEESTNEKEEMKEQKQEMITDQSNSMSSSLCFDQLIPISIWTYIILFSRLHIRNQSCLLLNYPFKLKQDIILPLEETNDDENDKGVSYEGFGRIESWGISGYEEGCPIIWIYTKIADYECLEPANNYRSIYNVFLEKAHISEEVY